jgi:outer membrane biosynthesis protein TonB
VEITKAAGDPQLVDAVAAVVRKWRYSPMKIDGTAYELRLAVEVLFSLQ